MRIVVIGATGHIGTFLVPRLVRAGHEVISISRGERTAYVDAPEWQSVQQVLADRAAEDRDGTFPDRVAALHADVVVDLICFTIESASALVDRLRGELGHLVHCGSIWRSGPSRTLPMSESTMTPPFGEYGVQKDRIARMLAQETADGGLVTTSLHPGHISGPGWAPIGPTGNLDLEVWRSLAAGRPLAIPGLGTETMHHVHADDVAQAFEGAIEHRDQAAGEDFFITAPDAFTVRGYAETAAAWFGQEALLDHVTWDTFRSGLSPEHAESSWAHLIRSQFFSVAKAAALIGYSPAYSVGETTLEAVRSLIDEGTLVVDRPLVV